VTCLTRPTTARNAATSWRLSSSKLASRTTIPSETSVSRALSSSYHRFTPHFTKNLIHNRLPNVPRPRLSLCILADAADVDRAKQVELEYMTADDLKKCVQLISRQKCYHLFDALRRLNKNKKLVKKLAKKYDAFLSSESLIKQIPRLLGPGLSKGASEQTVLRSVLRVTDIWRL
jgi:hypothetical protein